MSKNRNNVSYDCLIVGAGMSGINTAYQLLKKKPQMKILLVEKNEKIGGRIQSINLHHNQSYESGSIRFYPSHLLMLKLLKEFKQTKKDFYVIPRDMKINYAFTKKKYAKYKESDMDLYKILLDENNVNSIPEKDQIKITLNDYATKILGQNKLEYLKVLNAFPHIFQTSMTYGLYLLARDFIDVPEYYILKNITLTDLLYQMLEKIHVDLHLSEELKSYEPKKSNLIEVKTNLNKYYTKNLVLAIPQSGLKKLKLLPPKLVNTVFPVPLCRIFAIYPKHNYWYEDIDATYTNENIQRIYLKGTRLVQISYSSADKAEFWKDFIQDQVALKNELQKELIKMFPQKKIGHPEWIKTHFWNAGIHMWKSRIEGDEITKKIIQPDLKLPIYVANEAYSYQQRWMEGALEMSQRVVDLIINTAGSLIILRHI